MLNVLEIFSIFSCVLNVLEFFSILELETLELNTYGNTNACCQGIVNTWERCVGSRHRGVLVRECCHRVLSGMEIICV